MASKLQTKSSVNNLNILHLLSVSKIAKMSIYIWMEATKFRGAGSRHEFQISHLVNRCAPPPSFSVYCYVFFHNFLSFNCHISWFRLRSFNNGTSSSVCFETYFFGRNVFYPASLFDELHLQLNPCWHHLDEIKKDSFSCVWKVLTLWLSYRRQCET